MVGEHGWLVLDPGESTLSDIYTYELEYLDDDGPTVADFLAPEEQTTVMPARVLVEGCRTSAALRHES